MGASPARVIQPLAPAHSLRQSPQQQMLGLQAIQRLFLPTDIGVLFDPTASALYADAAGTTPAVVGGPVGLRVNVSGVPGMPNASQGTTALCPVLRETPITGRRWLEAPDSDDALNLTFASEPGECDVGVLNGDGSFTWTRPTLGTTVNVVTRYALNAFWIMRKRAFEPLERAVIEQYAKRYAPAPGEWT